MVQADREEARGNAEAALNLLCSIPDGPEGRLFWHPERVRSLAQLFMFQDVLPSWTTSRWVLAQAQRTVDLSGRGSVGRRTARAVQIAGDLQGGLPGGDLESAAVSRLVDHDWVFRQLHLYELGGLQDFVRHQADERLLDAADDLQAWATAPMRGLQLHRVARATVTWQDLADGSIVVVPNNGCALRMNPGDCAIGRLVPTTDGLLPESVPLRVPEPVARRVAHEPADWVGALRERPEEDRHDGIEEFGLLHDVPAAVWRSMVAPDLAASSLSTVAGQTARVALDRARTELATFGGHRVAGAGEDLDIWPCLGAAMLDPEVAMGIPDVIREGDLVTLRWLADVIADPAAALLRFATDDPRVA